MRSQTPDLAQSDGYEWARELVADATIKLAAARKALEKEQRAARIKCCRCGRDYPVSEQVYIQTYWYVEPHGCTGGDYWRQGEANWPCPGCGFKNRFDDIKDKYQTMPNDFYRPEIVAIKHLFASVRECHCTYNNTPCKECRKATA